MKQILNWFKKQKIDPTESYLANGKFCVKEVNSPLGRYAVINENEIDANWLTISYFRHADEANCLAEAYNRIANVAQTRNAKLD